MSAFDRAAAEQKAADWEYSGLGPVAATLRAALAEIDRLAAEVRTLERRIPELCGEYIGIVARLREALKPFATYSKVCGEDADRMKIGYYFNASPTVGDYRRAAEALGDAADG